MMGEELNACPITENGLLGDRSYGVVDAETGRLANAKNPKKWPGMFQYRAVFTEEVNRKNEIPPVAAYCPGVKRYIVLMIV